MSHSFKKAYLVLSQQDWELLSPKVSDLNQSLILCAHPVLAKKLSEKGLVAASFGEFFSDKDHFQCLMPLDLFSKKLEVAADSLKTLHSIKHSLIYYSRFYLAQASFYQRVLHNFLKENKTINHIVLYNSKNELPLNLMQDFPHGIFFDFFTAYQNKDKQEVVGFDRPVEFELHGTPPIVRSEYISSWKAMIYHFVNQFSLWTLGRFLKRKTVLLTTDSHGMTNLGLEPSGLILLNGINKTRVDLSQRKILKDCFQLIVFCLLGLLKIKNTFFKLSADFVFDFYPLPEKNKKIDSLIVEIKKQKIENNHFNELLPLYCNQLSDLERHFNKLHYLYFNFSRLFSSYFKRNKEDVFIVSAHSLDGSAVIGELAKDFDLNAVLISHGSHYYPDDQRMQQEMTYHSWGLLNSNYPICAIQSPLAGDFLKQVASDNKIFSTGPLLWGKMKKSVDAENLKKHFGIKPHQRVVVHAASYRLPQHLRFAFYETLEEYVKSINELSKAIEEIEDCVLLIKFRGNSGFSLENLKELVRKSEKNVFSEKEGFLDVLNIADLVTSYSSTTMEEAIENLIPVLEYGGNGRFDFLPGFKFENESDFKRNALYTVGDESKLSQTIKKILEEFEKRPLSEEEVLAYRFPKNERVSLNEIINGVSK